MDFKSRFKGKMTVMNKDGVIGIVNQPSLPILKNNQYYAEKDNPQPITKKISLHTEKISESKSHIFTNIQIQQHKNNNLKNAGVEILKQSKMKTEMEKIEDQKPLNRFSLKFQQELHQLDMDEYEIVAIPRNMLGQFRQQISVDRYALTHSFAPEREQSLKFKQYSPGITSQQSVALQNKNLIPQRDFVKPPFFKQQSERFEKNNNTIQLAGLGTLRENLYTKR